ncbi:phospholipase D-like domain-containing protein, partial [Desulfovibrio sp. OttesenSCG-928-F07]|nr:phospholipase D-like domain-containing protein [Desulfovibrio sp. OttesenSCG-928-F07]
LHALLHKREPYSALVWVSVCLSIPLLGPLLYYMFGFNRIHRHAAKLMKKSTRHDGPTSISTQVVPTVSNITAEQFDEMSKQPMPNGGHIDIIPDYAHASPRAVPLSLLPARVRTVAGIGQELTQVPLLSGNSVIPLFNGEEAYPAMLEAINKAERRVWLTTYIFDNDKTGKSFIQALEHAKNRGVDVRVLVDGVGVFATFPRTDKTLRKKGIPVASFLPPRLIPPQVSINLRNHRKLLIIDECTAFTGGMNITDVHLVNKTKSSGIQGLLNKMGAETAKDLHFKVSGSILAPLIRIFARDWQFCTGESLNMPAAHDCMAITGNSLCRAILDGPDDYFDVFYSTLLGVISAAKSSIKIMTPYFLPPRELETALQSAAMRGVDITIILPKENDHRIVAWATNNAVWGLLERGIKIYYQPPPFDHTKLLLVDGYYVHMGSANMDPRSFRLNFELTMEIFDLPLASRLETHFKQVQAESALYTIDDVNARSLPVRVRDALCWMLSPYL